MTLLLIIVLTSAIVTFSYRVEGLHISSKNEIKFNENVQVTTEYGIVEGVQSRTIDKKKTFYAFYGIPYAEPPIGDLRFLPPKAPKYWKRILNGSKEKDVCVQTKISTSVIIGSEDCLYLNIYSTQLPSSEESLRSVMVWIYGGGFNTGDGNYKTYGPDFLLNEDVLVVTFNYRLGVFGFLSTGDLAASGNNGLRDQILALRWVKQNIAAFGGNPDKITIFGQSSGAASVAYLLQTNLTKGLFHRAILQSGNSLCPWAISRHARETAFNIGKHLQIFVNDSRTLVNRLRQVDYEDLQKAAAIESDLKKTFSLVFSPVIEIPHANSVVSCKSYNLLSLGHFAKIPLLVGFTSEEGKDFFYILDKFRDYINASNRIVPIDMNVGVEIETVAKEIKRHYFGRDGILTDRQLTHYISDNLYVRATREYVKLTSKRVPTYFYRLSYMGKLGRVNMTGVGHTEDLNYIFRKKENPDVLSENDAKTRYRMVKLWTNFAKNGNPTPVEDPLLQNVNWDVASSTENLSYLDIGENLVVRKNPHAKDMDFWDRLYSSFGNPPYDTYR